METKKATSFNYETYVVHVEITSKVNFVEHQSAKSIEDIVLKAINFDSIDNTIVKSFVKSFKFLHAISFTIKGFHNQVSAKHLFYMSVDMAQIFLLLGKILLRLAHDQHDNPCR